MKANSCLQGRRAFTLLELLVGMAVIGVLTCLLIVATTSVRRRTDETASLNNMRQIGAAFLIYAQEHDGDLPGRLGGDVAKWPRLLSVYLKDVRVYAAPGPTQNFLQRNLDPLDNMRNNTSYIMNGFNDLGSFQQNGFTVRLVSIERPSTTLLLGSLQPGGIHYYMDFMEKNQDDVLDKKVYGDGSPYLFSDGAAKFITQRDYNDELWLVDKSRVDTIRQQ